MKILATVFAYNRPTILRHCVESIYANTLQPDEVHLVDDGSNPQTAQTLDELYAARTDSLEQTVLIRKRWNRGASHSGRMALAYAHMENPKYWFPIEADYVFKRTAFETVIDTFENDDRGRNCLGIVGYDHPGFYHKPWRDQVFPDSMRAQVGEDNVNRAALYKMSEAGIAQGVSPLELASNTCPTCYLHWHKIQEIAEEFPDLNVLLGEAFDPQDNPNYPDSGKYRKGNIIDDGMLSHAISLFWNRWAIKHGIDREKYAAWLNIKPSVAQNYTGGGNHASGLAEMQTDGGSPSWVP